MAFYTVVLLYEYAVLYFLAAARFAVLIVGRTRADMTLVATWILHAQELLLVLVVGAFCARIIQHAFDPYLVLFLYEFFGVRDVALPNDCNSFLKLKQVRHQGLQQVSGTRERIMLLEACFQIRH